VAGKIKPPAVIWSPRASSDLQQLVEYLERQWNDAVIRDFLVRLEGAIERVQAFPTIGRASTSRRNVRLFVIAPHHELIYQYFPRKKVIAILQLWDTRQEPKRRSG